MRRHLAEVHRPRLPLVLSLGLPARRGGRAFRQVGDADPARAQSRTHARGLMSGTSPDIGSRQLEAVLALAEYGSFVAAAARLRLSQPALTRMVKRLEAELGVRLFDRSTRRVEITAAGRAFAAVAERMLNDLGITVQSVREAAQEGRGLVVVSSVMSVAGGLLPRMIAAYRDDRPGVEIHVREGIYATILDD